MKSLGKSRYKKQRMSILANLLSSYLIAFVLYVLKSYSIYQTLFAETKQYYHENKEKLFVSLHLSI